MRLVRAAGAYIAGRAYTAVHVSAPGPAQAALLRSQSSAHLARTSVLTSWPTRNIHLIASVCNAPACFRVQSFLAGRDPAERDQKPKTDAFPTDDSDTLPSHVSLVAEIGIDEPLAYPAGKGSAALLRSISQSGRERWARLDYAEIQ